MDLENIYDALCHIERQLYAKEEFKIQKQVLNLMTALQMHLGNEESANAIQKSIKVLQQNHYNMMLRCYDRTNEHYRSYGHMGITVCDEWADSVNTYIMWALSHGFFPGQVIHRLNTHKGYSPTNCIVMTKSQHARLHGILNKEREAFNQELKRYELDQDEAKS